MKRIYTILLALLPLALMAQQNKPKNNAGGYAGTAAYDYPDNFTGNITLNYVRTIEPIIPTTYAGLTGLRNMSGRTLEQTLYMDGYLRPLQAVIKKSVNAYGRDLVKFYNYDASGLITDDMLPFVKTDRSLAAENKFDKRVQGDQIDTYTLLDLAYVGDNYRFERTVYEPSLLGRVVEKRGAGDSWTGKNKGVQFQTRQGNNDAVRRWAVDYSGSTPTAQGTYANADILVQVTTDEDGLVSESFYDLEGRLIATDNDDLRTYYLYDIYDRLRYVVPAKAVESLQANSWAFNSDIINGLCFKYDYDNRGNQTKIKKPGIEPTEFRYDLYGRVVFSQDARQRNENTWVFYKYDVQGRLIQQGLFNTANGGYIPNNPEDIAPYSIQDALVAYVYNTPVYKSSDYQYNISDAEFYIHYYFDDYDFIDARLTTPNGSYTAGAFNYSGAVGNATEGYNKDQSDNTTGLLTGIYTAVSDNSKWIAHVNYYNSDGQLIQTLSDDLEGRISVSGTGYDFRGNTTKTVFQNNDATIQKKYVYDSYGRLRHISHKIGNATAFRRIAQYEYDEIGRMKYKKLGSINYTEIYDYNIRGWITGINKKYAAQATEGFHFGEELFYEKGFEEKYFNGRLSGMQWRSRGTQDQLRAYGYIYDSKQRLTKADYYQQVPGDWDKVAKDFTTDIGYDANGNIQNMKHMGLDAGHNKIVLDDLTYEYEQNTNKLLSVSESSSSLSTDPSVYDGLGDFRDASGGYDYHYDANGNLDYDANRQINSITTTWFTINKPVRVEMQNGSTVYYIYDAMGNLLRKRTQWLDLTYNDNKTDYVGELTYENNTVSLIAHDEGRIRSVTDPATALITYEYDYYLRDHLQNIRAIITENVVQGLDPANAYDPATYNPTGANSDPAPVSYDVDPVGYIATSEPTNATWETDLFDRVNETRGTRPLPTSPDDNYAAILNAASSRVLGPGKLVKVMSGDRISFGAEAFFYSGQNPFTPVPINTIASQVISALSGAAAATGEIFNVFSQAMINTELIGMALTDITSNAPNDTTAPSAYLNYLVFDEAFQVIPEASGALQVQTANAWQNMTVPDFEIQQNGYVYVFTSNQSQATVSTDNLTIFHWQSVLLEEFHYYPFGLTFEVSSQLNLPGSNVRYNSQSIERNEFTTSGGNQKYGLNWYDFMARSYDAQTGRWMQPDPMMQHASPYLAMSNNPTIFTDPLGLSDGPGDPELSHNDAGYTYYYYGRNWIRNLFAPGNFYTYTGNGGEGDGGPTDYGRKMPLILSQKEQEKFIKQNRDEANRKSLEADLTRAWGNFGEIDAFTGAPRDNIPNLGDPIINAEDFFSLGVTLAAKTAVKGAIKVGAVLLPMVVRRGAVATKGGVQATKSAITGFGKHGINRAIERGFKTPDILKIVKEGTPVQAMGRYGTQTRYTLGGNTVILNAQGKLVTVFSNAPGTANGLGKGFFIPFK
jgi:RHS repeat-associated protein